VEGNWKRIQEVIDMQEGLLWFDADPKRDLAEKVARAADRYRLKFGCRPNLCYVNPSSLGRESAQAATTGALELNGVRVVPADNILKHHFWIGVEELTQLREAA
jgi:hypothetical protein